jgi:hypothetical protein
VRASGWDEGGWYLPRWVTPALAAAAAALVPWIVLLVRALPPDHRAAHWDVAWGGFDVAIALLLLAVAVAAWRHSPWLGRAATATATLLLVDAWFDLLTASTHGELVDAIAEAALFELPLAVLCLLLARAVERRLGAFGALQPAPQEAREHASLRDG